MATEDDDDRTCRLERIGERSTSTDGDEGDANDHHHRCETSDLRAQFCVPGYGTEENFPKLKTNPS